ncbi:MAG TPA: 2-dehydropantoate 2-reductase [Roseiflexaceae bacterium]|nr:2-dehydropantoate 2-reductase [Roseiflexaceae bacterium]
MKIGIIGAGALGSLIGFYLSEQADVWLLSRRPEQVEAINRDGLRRELDGAETTRHLRASADPSVIGRCDLVVVLVKSYQTAWAAEQARLLIGTEGLGLMTESEDPARSPIVVTLQNGLGNRELLAAALGPDRVGQGVTALGATLLGPGRVREAGQGVTVFGAAPHQPALMALAELFRACGLPAEIVDDLESLIWGKLVVNAGINALTALLRVPNGALVENPDARALVASAVAEAAAVARALGIALPYDDPLERTQTVARATKANHSSMLQDVLRGSPTEIDAINGAIEREGRRLGIPTPINSMLAALVRALESTAGTRV